MMENINVTAEIQEQEGGKIIFASEVIATIAGLAAAEVKGVANMSGGVVEGFSEKLGRKNLTKGIKVEMAESATTIEANLIVEYGYRIQEVCLNVQKSVKNAIETMTGLQVNAVNINVQGVDMTALKAEKALVTEE